MEKLTFRALALRQSEGRRANARNVSFSISVRWSIYIINSVDKPNFRVSLPHRRSTTVSLETNPLYSSVPELSIITNHMMDLIYGRWHHLLTRYNHDLFSPLKLLQYAQVIEQAGAALDNCWGFWNSTSRL